MKPDTRTVNDLFERDVRYVVPLYQRPYVWDEEDQWEPLWEDVRVLLEHQLDPASNGDGALSHFLGAIVLEQQTQTPGAIPVYTVIDGQQRLTTLQVLLAAASAVATTHSERDGKLLARLTRNDDLKAEGDELFKVWPTNANRAAFAVVMAPGGPSPERDDDPGNRIDEAYDYFRTTIARWVVEPEEADSTAVRVNALRVTLCDLLKLVSITLESDDNAQVIFETLNARGTPLLALDLVKNTVFHKVAQSELDSDALYEGWWKPQLDDDYWRDERRQGRLYRAQGELFLMHWLGMKLARVIPATELFDRFRKDILQRAPEPDVAELIRELCRDARTLRSFDEQPVGSVEAAFFARLDALDTSTVLPLVLLLFRDGRVAPERRRRSLRMLESWLTRRALMRLTTRAYNREVPILLRRVAADVERADEVILEHLAERAGEAVRWPHDGELTSFLTERDLYGTVSQRRLEMALAAVEQALRGVKTEPLPLPQGLTLEHVMPRRWEDSWPLPVGDTGAERVAERDAHVHKLGNLTLVTQQMNSGLSNSPWAVKRQQLNAGSVLLLNAELIDAHPASFEEADIDGRGQLLAARMCEVWPGPNAW